MTQLFLTLKDAVNVAHKQFGIDKELAKQAFEQKCYTTNNQYEIGYNEAIEDIEKLIDSLKE